jgi:hypothetical protein
MHMLRKITFDLLTLVLLCGLIISGLSAPVYAQDDDFDVTIDITGVIATIDATQLVLTDNTVIKISNTTEIDAGLQPGMSVVVTATIDGNDFVAVSIKAANESSDATEPTPEADDDDKGNGKGNNGKDNNGNKGKGNKGNDDNDDNNGKGNKGNNGNGNNGNGNGNNGNNGKGNKGNDGNNDKANASECTERKDNPVAVKLATTLGVTVDEIAAWHCQGIGFGEIARAYAISQNSTLTVSQILEMRKSGQGWGQILKAAGISGKDIAKIGKGKGPKNK